MIQTLIDRERAILALLLLPVLSACHDATTAPSPGKAITVSFCRGLEPQWVAFQDGDGPWTPAEPSGGVRFVSFSHSFTEERGAMAAVRQFASGLTTLAVEYATPSELPLAGDTVTSHCGPAGSRTLLGTVAGLGINDFAVVNAGFSSRELAFPASGNVFTLRELPPGPQDILAERLTGPDAVTLPTSLILRRNVDLPDNATLPVLDFASGEAFAPAMANLTITGLGASGLPQPTTVSTQTLLRTAHSESEVTLLSPSTSAVRTYYALPAARLAPGELQILTATASPALPNVVRSATMYFQSPIDRTLAFGAAITTPLISSVGAIPPTMRLRAQFGPASDYDRSAAISYRQEDGSRVVTVMATAAYAAAAGGMYELTTPDLLGVPGFDVRWALQRTSVFVTAMRTGGTLLPWPNVVPVDGSNLRTASLFAEFTP